MIHIQNGHIGYDKEIVRIENLELNPGELYALIGKNGAGKSTFFKTLGKQIPLLKGQISIDEVLITQIHTSEIPEYFAYVSTHFPDMDYVTVKEFISLSRTYRNGILGRLTAKDRELVESTIDLMELNHLANRYTSALSDGEQQLVAIAAALSQDSKCILLDEPTAFLDYSNKLKVLESLQKIAKESGKYVILSSHDLELSLEFIQRFLTINTQQELILLKNPSKQTLIQMAFQDA